MKKPAAYHGIQGVRIALKATDGYAAPVEMEYARHLNLNKQLTVTDRYADNRKILAVPSDKGYDGEMATTAQDIDLEKSLGYLIEGDEGLMDVSVTYFPRLAIYYEVTLNYEDAPAETVKVWLLNAEVRKGNIANQTDEENLNLGDYVYPIMVYGDSVLNAEGEEWRDTKGNKKRCFLVYAFPGDPNYEGFEDQAPTAGVSA